MTYPLSHLSLFLFASRNLGFYFLCDQSISLFNHSSNCCVSEIFMNKSLMHARATDHSDIPTSNLYVGNLPSNVTESDLAVIFEKHGVLNGLTCYASRNFAFVYYKRKEDAKAAKNALQGFMIKGNPMRIEFAKPAKPSKQLWVGGFGPSVTKDKLEQEFLKIGKLEDFKFFRDRNTALVEFARIEDAVRAVENLNGMRISRDRVRVDYLRSHHGRREQFDFHDPGNPHFRPMVGHPPWMPEDLMSHPETIYSGHKRPLQSQSFEGQIEGLPLPTKMLWVGYPPSVVIDEEMLHNAMILYGEIEKIKCYPSRHYSFVEFRSVEEARRAKEALQGRLFNDPRISIMFSSSELAPNDDFYAAHPGFRGPRPDLYNNDSPFRPPLLDGFGHNCGIASSFPRQHPFPGPFGPGIPRPFGPRGGLDPVLPPTEFNDHATHPGMSDFDPNGPSPRGLNRRRLSPPAGLLPASSLVGKQRSKISGWDVLEPDQFLRDSKRSRIDSTASLDDRSFVPGKGDDYAMCLDQPYATGPLRAASIRPLGMKGHMQVHADDDYIWRGVIAKGSAPVCSARCVPIGKGLECELPEIVNCTARTGLDILTKHYADAIGFEIVYFLPDSEDDFSPYTEFLHYLSSKNRAGVVRCDDGTTLFLVPPSDFLTKILDVAGPERLYGVVLKLPQQHLPSPAVTQQQAHHSTNPIRQKDPQPVLLRNEYKAGPTEDRGWLMGNTRTAPTPTREESTLRPKAPFPPTEPHMTQPPLQEPATSGVASVAHPTLTPELIATLTYLQQANSQPSAGQSPQLPLSSSIRTPSVPVQTSGKGNSSQGWSQELQPPEQAGKLSQLLGNQLSSHEQLNNGFQTYPSSNINNPTPVFPDGSQKQNPAYNLPQQVFPSAKPHGVPHSSVQRQHFVPPTQAPHQYQLEDPRNIQKNYGVPLETANTSTYGTQDFQPPKNPISIPNLFQGASYSPSENIFSNPIGNINPETQNHAAQHQSLSSVAGQSTTEAEVDKNQKYQSTLQLAASLLLQIQQRQQQQQQ